MKKLLVLLVIAVLATVAYAEGSQEAEEQAAPEADAAQQSGREAPMLRAMVERGELPPLEERLPDDPSVITPIDEIGEYGGSWNRAWTGPSDGSSVARLTVVSLVMWSVDGSDVGPGLARDWSFSSDARSVTYRLREGLKWSDGAPFTADDIMFWFEDIVMNDELSPAKPGWLRIDGQLGEVQKIDDLTVRFVFAEPYPIFNQMVAWQGNMFAPKHYLEQFHAEYADQASLEAETEAAGFENWYELFLQKNSYLDNPDRPTMRPWKPTNTPDSSRYILERNPFYWRVDTAGNQLPYIDEVVFTLTENVEVINLSALAGDLDMQIRHMDIANYPTFMANRQQAGYEVHVWRPALGADPGITLNLTHQDPALREVINDVRFRRALSVAIDREEINDLIYHGLGNPQAATVSSYSPFYEPEFAEAYAQYDPAQANAWLDEMGLTSRDADGFRLRPDGEPLEITIDTIAAFGPWGSVSELVAEYWRAVGVRARMRILERSLFFARVNANDIDATAWSIDWTLHILVSPRRFVPESPNGSRYAPAVGEWVATNGASGEEPWGDLRRVLDLYNEAVKTTDEQYQRELVREILEINAENVWTIGTVGEGPSAMGLAIVGDHFRNVPETAVSDVILLSPRNTNPEQYFMVQN